METHKSLNINSSSDEILKKVEGFFAAALFGFFVASLWSPEHLEMSLLPITILMVVLFL